LPITQLPISASRHLELSAGHLEVVVGQTRHIEHARHVLEAVDPLAALAALPAHVHEREQRAPHAE